MDSLRNWPDFKRVLDSGRKFDGRYIVLYALKTDQPFKRIGILVGKRFANAVKRNRVKRLIREAYRLSSQEIQLKKSRGIDIVVIPRKRLLSAKSGDLVPEMKSLLKKAVQ